MFARLTTESTVTKGLYSDFLMKLLESYPDVREMVTSVIKMYVSS